MLALVSFNDLFPNINLAIIPKGHMHTPSRSKDLFTAYFCWVPTCFDCIICPGLLVLIQTLEMGEGLDAR